VRRNMPRPNGYLTVSTVVAHSAGTPAATVSVAHSVRVNWVDTAKGLGIILVVFGHVIRGLANSDIWTWSPTNLFIDGWIYAFHMPLFFFLSGLFLVRSANKPWFTVVTEKLRTLAYPYFLWSIITLLIKAPLGGITNRADGLTEFPLILYRPIEQYWFLYVLFVLSLSIAGLLKFRVPPFAILALAIVIYPGILPISNYGWGVLALASTVALYVALGTVVGSYSDIKAIFNCSPGRLAFVVFAGLTISSLGGLSALPDRLAFAPILALAGTSATVALAVLADTTRVGTMLRLLGRYSLEIYVAHTIASAAARIALLKFGHISAPGPHLILGTLAGLFVPLVFARFLDCIGFRYAFTLPAARKPQISADTPFQPPPVRLQTFTSEKLSLHDQDAQVKGRSPDS
jgi:fucose 4-O-acetylase-like acetyltransferase